MLWPDSCGQGGMVIAPAPARPIRRAPSRHERASGKRVTRWTLALLLLALLLAILGAPTWNQPTDSSIAADRTATSTTPIYPTRRGSRSDADDSGSGSSSSAAHDSGNGSAVFRTGIVASLADGNDGEDLTAMVLDCNTVEALLPLTMTQINVEVLGTRGMLLVHCAHLTLPARLPSELSDGTILFNPSDLAGAGLFGLGDQGAQALIGGPLIPWWTVIGPGPNLASAQLAHLNAYDLSAGGAPGFSGLFIRPSSNGVRQLPEVDAEGWSDGPGHTDANTLQTPGAGTGPHIPGFHAAGGPSSPPGSDAHDNDSDAGSGDAGITEGGGSPANGGVGSGSNGSGSASSNGSGGSGSSGSGGSGLIGGTGSSIGNGDHGSTSDGDGAGSYPPPHETGSDPNGGGPGLGGPPPFGGALAFDVDPEDGDGPGSEAVPEPAVAALLAVGAMVIRAIRRRSIRR
jgi:hypothetical protein